MRCDEAGPLLLGWEEGRLDAAAARRVGQHLEHCEACREIVEAQRRVSAILAARPLAEAPWGFSNRVMARLATAPGWVEVLNWRAWTVRLAPVAAGLVVVATLGFGPTEAAAPIEFSDLVTDWVAEDDAATLPAFSLLWQEEVTDDTLLEAVLTADPGEPF